MYHYTGPRRAVCTAVTGTRRACVLFSLLLRPGHRLLLPLPSSSSRYIRVYVERARYAHRPSNRGTTRVKTISSPRRCANARLCCVIQRAIKLATNASVGIHNSNRFSALFVQNGSEDFISALPSAARMIADHWRDNVW